MSSLFDKLKNKIIGKGIGIVFPESSDERILTAAQKLHDDNLLKPIMIGKKNPNYPELTFMDPSEFDQLANMVDQLVDIRKGKLTREKAEELVYNPNYFGTMLVKMGLADGLVSGATHSTADTIRPALQIIKTKPHITKTFGYFLMLRDETTYIMADCAINPNPSANDLAEFAVECGRIAPNYDVDPKVAMLSFSTKGSAVTPETEKVVTATKIAKEMDPNLAIDGEMQFDAAIVESVGQFKFPGSKVAGHANVFVFPDLNAGNIGYKIAQRLGGFEAVGPFLAGLNSPVNDLSRGCDADDAYLTAIVTAVQTM